MPNKENEFIDALYRDYFDDMFTYANASLNDEFLAQDLVHDAFHLALERVDELQNHPNLIGWLKIVIKNKVKEYHRERKAFLTYCQSIDDFQMDLPDSRFDPATLLEEESFDAILKKLQQYLTQDEYYLFRRFRLEHASHLQIAQELNISVWTSQKRWERVKKKLKKFSKNLSV